MKKFAFISRHTPTQEQHALAQAKGVELVTVGDRDAFSLHVYESFGDQYEGVVVVHPAAALRAYQQGVSVGIFENGQRSEEGGKPTFFAKNFHIYEPPTEKDWK